MATIEPTNYYWSKKLLLNRRCYATLLLYCYVWLLTLGYLLYHLRQRSPNLDTAPLHYWYAHHWRNIAESGNGTAQSHPSCTGPCSDASPFAHAQWCCRPTSCCSWWWSLARWTGRPKKGWGRPSWPTTADKVNALASSAAVRSRSASSPASGVPPVPWLLWRPFRDRETRGSGSWCSRQQVGKIFENSLWYILYRE